MCCRAAGCLAVSRCVRPFDPGGVPVSRNSPRKSPRRSGVNMFAFCSFGYFGSQFSISTSEAANALPSQVSAFAFTAT